MKEEMDGAVLYQIRLKNIKIEVDSAFEKTTIFLGQLGRS